MQRMGAGYSGTDISLQEIKQILGPLNDRSGAATAKVDTLSDPYFKNYWCNQCRCQLQISGLWDSVLGTIIMTNLIFGTPVGNILNFDISIRCRIADPWYWLYSAIHEWNR